MSLFVSHGDKGGCGKTVTCSALIDWLASQPRSSGQKSPIVIDTDPRNPDIYRMFKNALTCQRIDLRERSGWMDMIDILAETPERHMVMNMGAGIGSAMGRDGVDFFKLAKEDLKIPIHLLWTIDDGEDSVKLFEVAARELYEYCTTVTVLRNQFFGTSDKFTYWNGSAAQKQYENRGLKTLDLPEFMARVKSKLKGQSPQRALNDQQLGLKYSERSEITRWLQKTDTIFSAIGFKI